RWGGLCYLFLGLHARRRRQGSRPRLESVNFNIVILECVNKEAVRTEVKLRIAGYCRSTFSDRALRKVEAPDENLLGVEVGEEHISAGRIEIQSRHVVSAERENGDVA